MLFFIGCNVSATLLITLNSPGTSNRISICCSSVLNSLSLLRIMSDTICWIWLPTMSVFDIVVMTYFPQIWEPKKSLTFNPHIYKCQKHWKHVYVLPGSELHENMQRWNENEDTAISDSDGQPAKIMLLQLKPIDEDTERVFFPSKSTTDTGICAVANDCLMKIYCKLNGSGLGRGDYVYFSLIIAKIATYKNWSAVVACFVVLMLGKSVSIVLVKICKRSMPALPSSIFPALLVFVLMHFCMSPFLNEMTIRQISF